MVRIHAGLVAVVGAFAIYFLLDPCGGGGDLCLGGAVGLVGLAYCGIGIGAIATWWFGRRASPLLVWDSILVTLAGASLLLSGGGGVPFVMLGLLALVVLGVPGSVLSGRAVSGHKVERVLAIVALLATSLLGIGAVAVAVVGVIAMTIGWLLARNPAQAAPTPAMGKPGN